ncbi:hypothetical protein Flavo103_38950 [Flavobacterium collinsii]|nr:hypothetical protein Flavo103_38950 [Flavobacterium collinsii]
MVILGLINHGIPSDCCFTCQKVIPGVSSFEANPEETSKGEIMISCILTI